MLKTFDADEEAYEAFALLCRKERTKIGAKINELIKDCNKEHGDGNPQFTIEQFEDPDFLACPAFYRKAEDWSQYMLRQTPEELEKIKQQIILIDKKLGEVL
jgi:hypothetical protein